MASIKIDFLVRMIKIIIAKVSPGLKKAIKKGILNLEVKAKSTENPFDDLLVELLKEILL